MLMQNAGCSVLYLLFSHLYYRYYEADGNLLIYISRVKEYNTTVLVNEEDIATTSQQNNKCKAIPSLIFIKLQMLNCSLSNDIILAIKKMAHYMAVSKYEFGCLSFELSPLLFRINLFSQNQQLKIYLSKKVRIHQFRHG